MNAGCSFPNTTDYISVGNVLYFVKSWLNFYLGGVYDGSSFNDRLKGQVRRV